MRCKVWNSHNKNRVLWKRNKANGETVQRRQESAGVLTVWLQSKILVRSWPFPLCGMELRNILKLRVWVYYLPSRESSMKESQPLEKSGKVNSRYRKRRNESTAVFPVSFPVPISYSLRSPTAFGFCEISQELLNKTPLLVQTRSRWVL